MREVSLLQFVKTPMRDIGDAPSLHDIYYVRDFNYTYTNRWEDDDGYVDEEDYESYRLFHPKWGAENIIKDTDDELFILTLELEDDSKLFQGR